LDSESLGSGRYSLHDRLGTGGMAEVRKVWDGRLAVWRAIKQLRPEIANNPVIRRRFDQEARAMARLHHPHILAIHDVGDDDARPYLVMDFAAGGSLADRVAQDGPLAPALAARLVREALLGLDHAHREGVVHRDVKPHNLLVDATGRALVSDFGIARVLDDDTGLTRTGATVGTLAYMAPEQRANAASVDGRADVYAAAGSLYHLLTGREPIDLFLERPGTYGDVPPALAAIIRRGCQYEPGDRWQTAAAMAAALDACRGELGVEPSWSVAPTPPPPAPGPATWAPTFDAPAAPARAPRWPWIGVVAGILALAWAGWLRATWVEPRRWVVEPAFAPPGAEFVTPDGRWFVRDEAGVALVDDAGAVTRVPAGAVLPVGRTADGRTWSLDPTSPESVVLRSDDGERRPFAIPLPYDGMLALAPDGRQLAWYGPFGLRVAASGEAPRAVGDRQHALTVAWSPDSTRFAAIEYGTGAPPYELHVLDAAGVDRRFEAGGNLATRGGMAGVAWVDDHRVAALRRRGDGMELTVGDADAPEPQLAGLFDVDPAAVDLVARHGALDVVAASVTYGVDVLDTAARAPIAQLRDPGNAYALAWIDATRLQVAVDQRPAAWDVAADRLERGPALAEPGPYDRDGMIGPGTRCNAAGCYAMDGGDGAVRFAAVDPVTGAILRRIPVAVPGTATAGWCLGPDGQLAVAEGAAVTLIDPRAGVTTALDVGPLSRVDSLAMIGPGVVWAAGTTPDDAFVIEQLAVGVPAVTVLGTRDWVGNPLVSPDGARVAIQASAESPPRVTRYVER
jgi:tRNA A-37 threonylcarbamoyl transferase component Bud32